MKKARKMQKNKLAKHTKKINLGREKIAGFKFTAQAPKNPQGIRQKKAEEARCGHAGGVKKKRGKPRRSV